MKPNNELKIHIVNVNHGDATIIEFKDYDSIAGKTIASFAVVDFGAKFKEERAYITEYLKALIKLRKDRDDDFDYEINFACVTHPHDDHYGGLSRFLDEFAEKDKISCFWDCGFRTTAVNYNKALEKIRKHRQINFFRVAAGSEFEFGETSISVLAPSIDLRNRFDTYGIEKNDASIVLRIKYKNSYIILAGDAEFASWGKITEEFPRKEHIEFHEDAIGLSKREEKPEQLKCNMLRTSHHGSMHGSNLEYLERLRPQHVVFSSGSQDWYEEKVNKWKNYFPHPLITDTFKLIDSVKETYVTGKDKNIIFKYDGKTKPRKITYILNIPGSSEFNEELSLKWK